MAKRVKLTPGEIAYAETSPDALRAIAWHHHNKAVEADALGFEETAQTHTLRFIELNGEAQRLEVRYNFGLDPGFTE